VSVSVRAVGKVNLLLGVHPLRPDGYHDLTTVFHGVSLVDEIVAEPAIGLSLEVHGADVPVDATNLAWQAAERLAAACRRPADVHLVLRKAIPVAGGMAGGSADGAAALVACARLWGLSPHEQAALLPGLAAGLGSDVPFALIGSTALAHGRGEVLRPVECAPLHWVFVFADHGISAGDAYRELDRQRAAGVAPPPLGPPDALLVALAGGSPDAIGPLLGNDLESAALALAPALRDTLDAGRDAGAVRALISGSGPTCALLCRSGEHAAAVADKLAGRYRVAVATGPVPGPAGVA
jgi:4-diphosphocytidyl-2-C-methyl-D-erythritol kinase